MRRRPLSLLCGISLCALLLGGLPASAQTRPAPRIFSVVGDLTDTTLVISGIRFGEGAEVWVDGRPVAVRDGATDERLEIEVPEVWNAQPGTHRLIVRTALGQIDAFEVALGSGVGRPLVGPLLTEDSGAPYATKVGYQSLNANTGWYNTATGYQALYSNTTSWYNVATGYRALYLNSTGSANTAVGHLTMSANTTGSQNTAVGYQSLITNTTGGYNTASGYGALAYNTTAGDNAAFGALALFSSSTGAANTAVGRSALEGNASGYNNAAVGTYALVSNTTGHSNIAIGRDALYTNSTGIGNIAIGKSALVYSTADWNVAMGYEALYNLLSGGSNIAIGIQALRASTSADDNTAIGSLALANLTTGTNNVALGSGAGIGLNSGSNNVYVANFGSNGDQGIIRIGTTGTHSHIYLAGTVHADAFVLTNPGSSIPPTTPVPSDSSATLLREIQQDRRTIAAQAARLAQLEQRMAVLEALVAAPRPAAKK